MPLGRPDGGRAEVCGDAARAGTSGRPGRTGAGDGCRPTAAFTAHWRSALEPVVAATRDGLGLFRGGVVGDVAVVRRKAERGAEIGIEPTTATSPLHLRRTRPLEVARFWLERAVPIPPTARNESRVHAPHKRRRQASPRVAGRVIAFGGIGLNVTDTGGWTPAATRPAGRCTEANVDLLLLPGATPGRVPGRTTTSPIDVAMEGRLRSPGRPPARAHA